MLSRGDVLDGRYRVGRLIGSGGFSWIYEISHLLLGSSHALKILRTDGEGARARLLEEGRQQARLFHPNLLRVTDAIALDTGVGLVLERVEGPTLQAWLKARGQPGPLSEAQALGEGILAGMVVAHAAGLVHRDLKPANILLAGSEGRWIPKITDFGLVKLLPGEGGTGGTGGDTIGGMGTPGYMAPEQIKDAGSVDQRADVFALGVILYELLAGRSPFPASSASDYLQAVRSRAFAPLPPLPERLVQAVEGALHFEPGRRIASSEVLLRIWRGAVEPVPSIGPFSFEEAPPTDLTWPGATLPTLAPAPGTPLPPHNLPRPADPFVGREAELPRLARCLQEGPGAWTVLGPGGVGKTRLATQAALSALGAFPGGAWFCDLSDARDGEGLCRAVARGLEQPLGTDDPVERIGFAIASLGRTLVVLDNFEQLVPLAGGTLGAWRARAPDATFLVTSREALGLAGERLHPLEPLALPAPGVETAAEVGQSEAVALFLARVQARRPGFQLSDDNAAEVAGLVRALDGLPLALELAAARVGLLSLGQLRARLDQSLDLLRSPVRDAPERQATIRGALDWSWGLLSGWEQAALASLSVFEGGFSLEDAEEVLDPGRGSGVPRPLEAIESLLGKSLLRSRELPGGALRFEMLVSVHRFASEKRKADPELDREVSIRHGRAFAALARVATEGIHGRSGAGILDQLQLELDNISAASRRAARREDEEILLPLVEASWEALSRRGPLGAALALPVPSGCSAGGRARLLLVRGRALRKARQAEPALSVLEEALALFRAHGDRRRQAEALTELGLVRNLRHEIQPAIALLKEALMVARAASERWLEGEILGELGMVEQLGGNPERAEACLRSALLIHQEVGNRLTEGIAYGNLGVLLHICGRTNEAAACYRDALRLHQQNGDRISEGYTLSYIGNLELDTGRLDEARASMEASLAIHRRVGNRGMEVQVLTEMGRLARERGELAQAGQRYRSALERLDGLDYPHQVARISNGLGLVYLEEGRLEDARVELERGIALCRQLGEVRMEGIGLTYLARLHRRAGAFEAAGQCFEEALSLLEAVKDRRSTGICLGRLGELCTARGEQDRAEVAFARALPLLEESRDTLSQAMALAWRGRLRLEQHRLEEARADLAAAERCSGDRSIPALQKALEELRARLSTACPA